MDDVYQEEGERYMKKGILGRLGIAMCLCVGLLGTSTVYASPRADKYTSEFGTLHGEIEYIGTLNRRKNINFSTTTTKKISYNNCEGGNSGLFNRRKIRWGLYNT